MDNHSQQNSSSSSLARILGKSKPSNIKSTKPPEKKEAKGLPSGPPSAKYTNTSRPTGQGGSTPSSTKPSNTKHGTSTSTPQASTLKSKELTKKQSLSGFPSAKRPIGDNQPHSREKPSPS